MDARPRGESDLCLEGEGRSRVVTGQVRGEEGAPCAHKAPTSSPGPIKCGVMMRLVLEILRSTDVPAAYEFFDRRNAPRTYAKGLQIKLKLLERRGKHTSFEVPSPTTGWREEVAAEPTASGRGFRDSRSARRRIPTTRGFSAMD